MNFKYQDSFKFKKLPEKLLARLRCKHRVFLKNRRTAAPN